MLNCNWNLYVFVEKNNIRFVLKLNSQENSRLVHYRTISVRRGKEFSEWKLLFLFHLSRFEIVAWQPVGANANKGDGKNRRSPGITTEL